jgi:CheY-like chemotaxis protein
MIATKSLSILLIEDNVANQLVAKAYLVRAGHRLDTASTGLEGMTRFHEAEYDLVLMDLQMPEIDGFECTRLIRSGRHNADVPIIALTANVLRREQHRCFEAGMNGYFAKPIAWDELIARISELDSAA